MTAESRIAAAIGEPARARMLYCLMDNRARTSTELAAVAEVCASTASVHLNRLKEERLVKVAVQGKHRYYSLEGRRVAAVLEGLSVLAGASHERFTPSTPTHLRAARTCYDHMAGMLGVAVHDGLQTLGWITGSYEVTTAGEAALRKLGVDVKDLRGLRRRFAYPCLDWSERRSHVGGALGSALLGVALAKKWVTQELDSRALAVTRVGHRELERVLGVRV